MSDYKFWIFLLIWWAITTIDWAIDFTEKDGVKVQVHAEKVEKPQKKEENDGPKPSF